MHAEGLHQMRLEALFVGSQRRQRGHVMTGAGSCHSAGPGCCARNAPLGVAVVAGSMSHWLQKGRAMTLDLGCNLAAAGSQVPMAPPDIYGQQSRQMPHSRSAESSLCKEGQLRC